MSSYNKAILLGRLVRDPSLKCTDAGVEICTFTLAINSKYKGKDDTTFIDVTAFNKQAETCKQYLFKGNLVLVEGKLYQKRWETEDGQKRSKIEVVASSVTFMPKGENKPQEVRQEETQQQDYSWENSTGVPF